MTSTMKITIEITSADGEIVRSTRVDEIPGFDDFEVNGFRDSFGKIETAVLLARKEVSDVAVEDYLSNISKKKSSFA